MILNWKRVGLDDIRWKFFTVVVVRQWNTLSSEVVNTPPLEAFKAREVWTLCNLV